EIRECICRAEYSLTALSDRSRAGALPPGEISENSVTIRPLTGTTRGKGFCGAFGNLVRASEEASRDRAESEGLSVRRSRPRLCGGGLDLRRRIPGPAGRARDVGCRPAVSRRPRHQAP